MQKALELRKKSFLPLEVCEAKVGLEEKKKRKRREEKSSLALFRFDLITPWNFPGIVRNVRFNVSIFRVWTGRGEGGGLIVFTSCTRCPMGHERKTESFVKPF